MSREEERTLIRGPEPEDTGPHPADMAHLLVLDQPDAPPHRVPLGAEPLSIGRTVQNGLMLASDEISRRHCVVLLEDGVVTVTDQGSTNGTWVDGRRIQEPAQLPPGGVLRLGPYHLQYLCLPRSEMARNAGLERDIEKAGRYVTSLLPAPIAEGPVHADWRFLPCAEIGGDGFGWRFLDPGHFAVWLLDVSGRGAGAALLAASVMNALRAGDGADPADPAAMLGALNSTFQSAGQAGMPFTCWYAVADLAGRRLRFASAGHHPGWLLAPGAAAWVPLHVANPAIGLTPRWPYRAVEMPLAPDTRVVLFSDGAFGSPPREKQREALAAFLPQLSASPQPGVPEAERLLRAVMANRDAAKRNAGPLADDVSILTLDFA